MFHRPLISFFSLISWESVEYFIDHNSLQMLYVSEADKTSQDSLNIITFVTKIFARVNWQQTDSVNNKSEEWFSYEMKLNETETVLFSNYLRLIKLLY